MKMKLTLDVNFLGGICVRFCNHIWRFNDSTEGVIVMLSEGGIIGAMIRESHTPPPALGSDPAPWNI